MGERLIDGVPATQVEEMPRREDDRRPGRLDPG
jgi:hypothetical protein